ncbi:hypothetical protein ACVIGB_000817 [Bradyrhizobium sp. USDA 4341]
MSDPQPTPHQAKALRLAATSGSLRRLPGGYWVGSEYSWTKGASLPTEEYVGSNTVYACSNRGWLEQDGAFQVKLTDAIFSALEPEASLSPA